MLDTMVNKWNENRSEIAKLAKDVSYCASNNDKYCIQILDESAKQLSDIIIAIYDGLGFDDYVSCSYSGGVFNCGDLILEPLKKYLSLKKINLKAPVFELKCASSRFFAWPDFVIIASLCLSKIFFINVLL